MNPQHSSPARAASRCREALQLNVCTEYKSVHLKAYIRVDIHISLYLTVGENHITSLNLTLMPGLKTSP